MNRSPLPHPATAVLFAYHNVGVRGLATLLDLGLHVPLVVTHPDDPEENQWFDSVAEWAALEGIPTITPANPNTPDVIERVGQCRPDFIFSFYYRHMLGESLLTIPTVGAYNLHGSLLPKYRGRVPINWAVLHGERETGVSLHQMVVKPDAGDLIDQEAVTILTNDTAQMVFQKVVCAGERVLQRAVPGLINGTVQPTPLDLTRGSYYGRRRPEDGRIDWHHSAWQMHNLIRAVAPPFPGAFFDLGPHRLRILRSHYREEVGRTPLDQCPRLYWEDEACYADCTDGRRLLLRELFLAEQRLNRTDFLRLFGADALRPDITDHKEIV